MSVQYHGLYIEDLLARINLEIRDYNLKNKVFTTILVKPFPLEVPKQYKSAIESLEVL